MRCGETVTIVASAVARGTTNTSAEVRSDTSPNTCAEIASIGTDDNSNASTIRATIDLLGRWFAMRLSPRGLALVSGRPRRQA
jgi:hypothetical protein